MCTARSEAHFSCRATVESSVRALKESATRQEFAVWAYCFMPDHLHLLLEGRSERSSLSPFVKDFKQRTGFEFKTRCRKRLWQPSYYDRVLRRDEDMEVEAEYIFGNPVRRGLVSQFDEYPYLGSFVFD
jgi:putative transposase